MDSDSGARGLNRWLVLSSSPNHEAISDLTLILPTTGYLGVAHVSGGAFSTLGLALGGDRGALRRIAVSFLEDIQFKDFVSAAGYHAPDIRGDVDIPFLLQRLFTVRPEALDIMDYDVVFAEIDSGGPR